MFSSAVIRFLHCDKVPDLQPHGLLTWELNYCFIKQRVDYIIT